MMKRIRLLILTVLAGSSLAAASVSMPASAYDPFDDCPPGSQSQICKAGSSDSASSIARNIVSILLWAIGAVAVIMIIIGGFKYVTSNGDSNSIQSAKNTILYSAIGLAVAILGQAIVVFVVGWFS